MPLTNTSKHTHTHNDTITKMQLLNDSKICLLILHIYTLKGGLNKKLGFKPKGTYNVQIYSVL